MKKVSIVNEYLARYKILTKCNIINNKCMSFIDKEIENRSDDLVFQLSNFGSLDVVRCVQVLMEADIETTDFVQYVHDFCHETETQVYNTDISALAYEYVLQEARREIEEKAKVDILNDLKNEEVCVHGNYCCSSFDFSNNAKKVKNTIDKISADKSRLLRWFRNQLN